MERRSRDGCEGGGGRPPRARQGRRGGAALRERPLPARVALAAARVPTLLPGLRAGAAAGARRVGANWVPAFPSPTRPSPQRSRSLEPDSPPGKLSRAPAWLNLAPTQARPSPYPAGRPAASFITRPWPWLCASCGPTLSALNPGLSGPSKTHWHAFPAFLLPSSQPSALCWPSPSPGSSLRSGSLQRSLWAGRTHRRALFPSALREMWGGGPLGSVAAGMDVMGRREWGEGKTFWEAEPAGAWHSRSLNVCPLVLWVFSPWTPPSRVREITCFSDSQEGNSYHGVGGESARSAVLKVLLWGYRSTF